MLSELSLWQFCADVSQITIFLPVLTFFFFFLFKDDIFSTGLQAKKSKPKSQSAEGTSDLRSDHKVSNIFDDPLNAFGSQ